MLVFSVGAYAVSGLRAGPGHYGYFFLLMLLTSVCCMFLALTAAALSKTTEIALSYFPLVHTFNMFYAGYVVAIPSMQDWQGKWLPYLTFVRFCFQGLVLNEFQDNEDLPASHQYINDLGFDFISREGCCAILLLFMGFYAVTLFLALKYVNLEER